MTQPNLNLSRDRSEWVSLRTLIVLRWIAIIGQIGAVVVADQVLALKFEVELCYFVVGLAVVFNIIVSFLFPQNKRPGEVQVAGILVFDVTQLCLLIYLTGGLNNPFALLVLAPVAVAAAALNLGALAVLVGVTIALITFVGLYFQPILSPENRILQMPDIFVIGFWIAILTGILFVATLVRRVTNETHSMGDALMATQLALSREQKLTDLGGVVAATAHELGTPLATIKLVSSELSEVLEAGSDTHSDAVLIGEQADRCRDILRSMGRAGKDDRHMRIAPFSALVEEAAEPHLGRGKTVLIDSYGDSSPLVYRQPEILHGIRNLIQNAVDFAESTVWVDVHSNPQNLKVAICDDGPGYPAHVFARLGEPFVSQRTKAGPNRLEYEGMGLGLFIAKTLLERSGAELTFANGTDPFLTKSENSDRKGAFVEVSWPSASILAASDDGASGLGENEINAY